MYKDPPNRRTKKVQVEIYEDSEKYFLKYYYILRKYLDSDRKIPAGILKKFLSYLKQNDDPTDEQIKARKVYSEIVFNKTIDRFINKNRYKYKKYRYDFKSEIGDEYADPHTGETHQYIMEDTFDTFLKVTLTSMIYQMHRGEWWDKDYCTGYLYDTMHKARLALDVEAEIFLTHFKLSVLSAFITEAWGYPVSNKKKMRNEDYFACAQTAIKKFKNKNH